MVLVFSCVSKRLKYSMEIADAIDRKYDLNRFIQQYFKKVDYGDTIKTLFENPIFPYKTDFINFTDSLRFCNMSIQQCWVKKNDDLYAFFIIIKRTEEIQKNISTVFGKYNASALITSQGEAIGGRLYIWRKEHFTVEQSSYFNISKISKYESCDLVICRNMSREQLAGARE